mgnify:CR=1 FL=1
MSQVQDNQVSKRYPLRTESGLSEKATLVSRLKNRFRPLSEFWALRDVSFSVSAGETLGIIGHNGAGKSTLFKLLSNITRPTTGNIVIRGRLAGLLEVGSGFHPELTGRENVYLSGSILGMRRAEITKKLTSILDFSGVRAFADLPIKRYSSGMYVRLGFSIAAHLDSDILLLDEVLAVGDAKFQQRCLERIGELRKSGRTVIFVSHDLGAVRQICERVIWMDRGRIAAEGGTEDIIGQYAASSQQRADDRLHAVDPVKQPCAVREIRFTDADGNQTTEFETGNPLRAIVEIDSALSIAASISVLFFEAGEWNPVTALSTNNQEGACQLIPGSQTVEFFWEALPLTTGIYTVAVSIEDELHEIEQSGRIAHISVVSGNAAVGRFYAPHTYKLSAAADTIESK